MSNVLDNPAGECTLANVPARTARRVSKPQQAKRHHFYLFLLGWTYYLLVPVLAGRLGLFESLESFELMSRYVRPTDPLWPTLIAYILALPVFFVAGSMLAQSLPHLRRSVTPLYWATRVLLPVYGLMLIIFAFSARANLFAGYAEDMDLSVVGPIATLQMALLLQYMLAKAAGLASARWAGMMLTISSVLLMSMGGRLYVVSSLVALYIYWWQWSARDARARRLSLVPLIVAPIGLAMIGMWRMGVFDPSALFFYLFAESMFTSISAFTLMASQGPALVHGPSDFLSAFLNIVPSALWPDKASMMVSLIETPLQFEAPFGATSIVTSTIGNFGFLGGPLFIGLVGFIMGRAATNTRLPTGRALYCYLCCLLPFMFFRDPFQVQVKVVITGFLLIWLNRLLASRVR